MQSKLEQTGPPVASMLFVDDRPATLRALEAVSWASGFQLVSAKSGRDALREPLTEDFALVILDVQMPGLDGFETAALMRKRERNLTTAIIFLTALYSDPQQAAQGYAAGAVGYICKPFDPGLLLAKVQVFADLFLANERLKRQAGQLAAQERELVEARPIAEAHAQASELAGLKNAFIASISHELRTPLHSLIGWTHLLHSGRLTDQKRDSALAIIERNAHQQAQLVDDLIDVAHLLTGTLSLDRQEIDLGALASVEVETVRAAFAGRIVQLDRDLRALLVRGDPARLRQALRHLLESALKFSEPDGRADVSLSRAAERALLVVRDNIEGIAAESLPFIFEPFRAEEVVEKLRRGAWHLPGTWRCCTAAI